MWTHPFSSTHARIRARCPCTRSRPCTGVPVCRQFLSVPGSPLLCSDGEKWSNYVHSQSEHNTILCRYPGTVSRAPSVDSPLVLKQTSTWVGGYRGYVCSLSAQREAYSGTMRGQQCGCCLTEFRENFLSSRLRQRSHLMPERVVRVRYSLGSIKFFQVPTLETQAKGSKGNINIFGGFYCTYVGGVVSLHWKLIWTTIFIFASCSCEIYCHLEESKIQEIVKNSVTCCQPE